MKSTLRNRLAGALLLSVFSLTGTAQAQIATDVTIDIDGIAILYAYTSLQVNIPSAALIDALDLTGCTGAGGTIDCPQGGGGTQNATVTGGNLVADFDLVPDPVTPGGGPRLVLDNVWSVLAFGGASANTTVSLSLDNATLANGGSSILLSSPLINGDSGSHTFPDPGLATPYNGDVSFQLDLTNLTDAGPHASTGTYTLEITGT